MKGQLKIEFVLASEMQDEIRVVVVGNTTDEMERLMKIALEGMRLVEPAIAARHDVDSDTEEEEEPEEDLDARGPLPEMKLGPAESGRADCESGSEDSPAAIVARQEPHMRED